MIRKKIRNVIGILIVHHVIRNDLKNNTEGWLVTRKNGTQQVIKIFSRRGYENIVRPALLQCKKNEDNSNTKMTNADRIRSMSDEELAELIASGELCDICPVCKYYGTEDCYVENAGTSKNCSKGIMEWLKSEVEE